MENLRTTLILEYLRKKHRCSLQELAAKFGVSRATIHRDARELAGRDAVRVVRGGLLWTDPETTPELSDAYSDRVVANRREKISLAKQAMAMINEGDIIFLDSSTTVYELAMLLKASNLAHLTIITNSLAVMQNFRKFKREWVLIGLGGNFDAQLNSILGATTLRELQALNITKAFFSAFGLDSRFATTNHERQAELVQAVIGVASKSYLLVDRSKLRRSGIYRMASRSAFERIFT